MASYTYPEAARRSGVSEGTLRKYVQRGKLHVDRADGVVRITDLDAFLAAEVLGTAVRQQRFADLGNIIGQLPPKIINAILEGMPTQRNAGSGEAFRRELAKLPRREAQDLRTDDPHFGYPIGYRHVSPPQWGRTSETTWSLDGATWTFEDGEWIGGGLREGRTLGAGITPAHPDATFRPLAPGRPVRG